MIDIPPNAPTTDCDRASHRIDPRIFDRPKIDNQAVVANSQASGIVAAAANREEQIVFAGKVYGTNYVRDIRAARDQARFFMDHAVIDLAGVIIICVAWLDQASTQVCLKIGDRIFFEHTRRI